VVVPEFPGFAADVLRSRTEHGALDGHAAMKVIVMARCEEALDRQAEENDALLLAIDVPAGNRIAGVRERYGADLEADLLEFGPSAAQELDRRADRDVEPVDPTVQRRQRRTHDGAATHAAVTTVPRAATR